VTLWTLTPVGYTIIMPFPPHMLIEHYSPSTGYQVQSACIVTYTKGTFTQIQTIKHISLACQTPEDNPEYFVKAVLTATSAGNGAGTLQTRQQSVRPPDKSRAVPPHWGRGRNDLLQAECSFFFNVFCSEVCSTEIHLDTRITKCSQFTTLHELCLV